LPACTVFPDGRPRGEWFTAGQRELPVEASGQVRVADERQAYPVDASRSGGNAGRAAVDSGNGETFLEIVPSVTDATT